MKMKKFIILLIFIVAVCHSGFCSEKNDSSIVEQPKTSYWGIRAGMHYPCIWGGKNQVHDIAPFSVGPGYEIGMVYHKSLNRRFFVEPGAYLYFREIQVFDDFYNWYTDFAHLYQLGLTVPVNFGLVFPLKKGSFDIHTGPMLDIGLFGKEKASFEGTDYKINRNVYHNFNRFNALWNIGIALYTRSFGFGLDYAPGFTDFIRAKDMKAYNSILRISVYYNFK